MLESLAPSRWDIFEDDIKAMVKAMRANLTAQDVDRKSDESAAQQMKTVNGSPADLDDSARASEPQAASEKRQPSPTRGDRRNERSR